MVIVNGKGLRAYNCTECGGQRNVLSSQGTSDSLVNSPLQGLGGHPWAATGLAHYTRHTLMLGASRTL
jgi:hypothetical protein